MKWISLLDDILDDILRVGGVNRFKPWTSQCVVGFGRVTLELNETVDDSQESWRCFVIIQNIYFQSPFREFRWIQKRFENRNSKVFLVLSFHPPAYCSWAIGPERQSFRCPNITNQNSILGGDQSAYGVKAVNSIHRLNFRHRAPMELNTSNFIH